MTRAIYFRMVILISLKKRAGWLFGFPLLLFVGLVILAQPIWFSAAVAFGVHLVLTGYAAWSSYQRHQYEYIS